MKFSITKVVGIAAILSAVSWALMFIVDPNSRPEIDGTEYIIWAIILVPGVIAFVYGIKALIGPEKRNVTRSIGSSMFILAGIVTTIMERAFASALGDGTVFNILMPLLCFAAVFLYVLAARYVLMHARISFLGVGDLFSKPFILLFSGFVAGCISGVFQTYVLEDMDKNSKALVTIVNLLLTLGVYQILASMLRKKSHHSQTSGPTHA